MTDYVPTQPTRARGPGTAIMVTLVALAFVAGIVVTGYAMKHLPWFGGTATATNRQRAVQADPTDYSPPDTLNASGESASVREASDPTMLAARAAALAGQLTALEARTAAVSADAAAARGQATRAEGLLIAFSARRALDRGLGLGYIEEQLRNRFGSIQPRAVIYVIQASRQPVTLEDLRQGLDAIAPEISTVSDDNWWQSLRRELSHLVVLRKAGTPSPLPSDRLARAKRLLEGGQVEAARAEVLRLPGAGDATNWLAAANRYVTARHALDLIENAAILGQAAPPPAPPAAVSATEPSPPAPTPTPAI